MSFTTFSLILLSTVALAVFIEVRRGLRRGFIRTAVGLAAMLVSALGAIMLAVWVSNAPAQLTFNAVKKYVPAIDTLGETLPHVEDLIVAVVDALVTPILFVAFFLVLRLILRIVVAILFRKWRYEPDDPRYMATPRRPNSLFTPTYEAPDAPWHRRHDRTMGGLAGGVCGFIAALCLLSPILGTLSTARVLLRGLDDMNVSTGQIISDDVSDAVMPYVNDSGVAILCAAGGNLAFDAVAITTLNDQPLSLRREVIVCLDVCRDISKVLKVVTRPDDATDEQITIIRGLGDRINESEFTRLLAADFLNTAAAAWLEGKNFMNLPRPAFGEILDPLMNEALKVCAEATPDCVGRDITTVLNVYLIAVEYGLTGNPNREDLVSILDEGGVLDRIHAELQKNPCMAHLSAELSNTALRIMAEAIDWANFAPDIYDELMGNLSEAMNLVNGMEGAGFAEQVETMTRYTMHYAEQYGVELPEGMAKMAATAMVEQLSGENKLTADHLDEFFQYYLGGGK